MFFETYNLIMRILVCIILKGGNVRLRQIKENKSKPKEKGKQHPPIKKDIDDFIFGDSKTVPSNR